MTLRAMIFGCLIGCLATIPALGQGDDLSLTVETSADRFRSGVLGEEGDPNAEPGAPGQPGSPQPEGPERPITTKLGWQKKGASRIYDAVDGRMIVNDVIVQPFRDSRREAARRYDNGTHGDEVPRDGVPSRVLVNSTDYMGPRTAANYDELKGILFAIGAHPDGPQRFFSQPMVSLDWDGQEIPWNPSSPLEPGIYRLTTLERRMYAFIIRDSLEIMRSYQNAEGVDLIPYEDRVSPPSGLSSNTLQARRDSKGIATWNQALETGEKQELERKMLAELAGTEIADASWFPGGVSALSLSRLRSGVAGSFTQFGVGAGAFGGGFGPGGFGGGAYGGGGVYAPGGEGGGFYGGQGFGPGNLGGALPPVPMGYNVAPQGISPMGGSLGFAF